MQVVQNTFHSVIFVGCFWFTGGLYCDQADVTVLVLSARDHYNQRQAIRDTWMNNSQYDKWVIVIWGWFSLIECELFHIHVCVIQMLVFFLVLGLQISTITMKLLQTNGNCHNQSTVTLLRRSVEYSPRIFILILMWILFPPWCHHFSKKSLLGYPI